MELVAVVDVGYLNDEDGTGLLDACLNGFGAAYFVRSFETFWEEGCL